MNDNIDLSHCRLYIVSPRKMDPLAFAPTMVKALDAGDVASFLLRLEGMDDEEVMHAIEILMPIAHDRDVAFFLDGKIALAKKTECDGVHLGQHDVNAADARKILGPDKTIGVTCHDSKHLGMTAAESGADYVSFGPFFPPRLPSSGPGATPRPLVSPDILAWWQETMEVPCVAAGGIRAPNCGDLVRAGADFVCTSTGIWEHPAGAAVAVRAFNDAIARASQENA